MWVVECTQKAHCSVYRYYAYIVVLLLDSKSDWLWMNGWLCDVKRENGQMNEIKWKLNEWVNWMGTRDLTWMNQWMSQYEMYGNIFLVIQADIKGNRRASQYWI